MATDPRSPQFWQEHAEGLRDEVATLITSIVLAGAAAGVYLLPSSIRVFADWDIINQHALNYLRSYLSMTPTGDPAFNWLFELTNSSRRQVVGEIDAWIRAGEPLPQLEARLAPIFGQPRAKMIATTEVTRIYAEGNLAAWSGSGVSGKRWMTAVDERVCPICGPMHGMFVEIDGAWSFTQEMRDANPELDQALRHLKQDSFRAPPAHVNCRCWLQPVVLEALEPEEITGGRFANA